MTVSTEVSSVSYDGDNVTLKYPIPFYFLLDTDLLVSRVNADGTELVLALGSDYTVTGAGDEEGGELTLAAPIPLTIRLLIDRDPPVTQETAYQANDPFPAKEHEKALDKLTMLLQRLNRTFYNSLHFPLFERTDGTLPKKSERKGMVQAYDPVNGLPIVLPIPSSLGAGDMEPYMLVSGVDFMPGDTTVTLPRAPGSRGNMSLFYDAAPQDFDQWSVAGSTVTLAEPIPSFITKIWGYIGTQLSLLTPPPASVTYPMLAADVLTYVSTPSVKTFGGLGDGVSNARTALQTNVPAMEIPAGIYRVSSNTTVTAELFFTGGRIRVPTGVTLTLRRAPRAGSDVIFEGGGTVINESGVIDVSWFDGADSSAKWNFASKQLTNTNTLAKMVAFPTPKSTDAWAMQSDLAQFGYGWAGDAPIDVTQLAGETQFITPAPFCARQSMSALWRIGVGTSKADGWHFPMKLLLDGNGKGVNGMEIQGASTFSLNFIEAQWCVSGLIIRPNGAKQVSGFSIGQVMVGGNTGTGIIIDGSLGPSNSVTDGRIGFANGVGAGVAGIDSFLEISGEVQNLNIPIVSSRAVNAGLFDYALAAATIVERNGRAPSRGINIGYVLTDSVSPTAKAVHIAGSASVKVSGVSIGGAIASVSPAVSIDNCQWIKIRDVDNVVGILIGSGASDTRLYGCNRANVADNGVRTMFDGHSFAPITAVNLTSNPFTYVNNNPYHVEFQLQVSGGTITTANYSRGGTTINKPLGGAAGAWLVAPGDNIAVAWTGTGAANIIPM